MEGDMDSVGLKEERLVFVREMRGEGERLVLPSAEQERELEGIGEGLRLGEKNALPEVRGEAEVQEERESEALVRGVVVVVRVIEKVWEPLGEGEALKVALGQREPLGVREALRLELVLSEGLGVLESLPVVLE